VNQDNKKLGEKIEHLDAVCDTALKTNSVKKFGEIVDLTTELMADIHMAFHGNCKEHKGQQPVLTLLDDVGDKPTVLIDIAGNLKILAVPQLIPVTLEELTQFGISADDLVQSIQRVLFTFRREFTTTQKLALA
jgi:hypothetical protein